MATRDPSVGELIVVHAVVLAVSVGLYLFWRHVLGLEQGLSLVGALSWLSIKGPWR